MPKAGPGADVPAGVDVPSPAASDVPDVPAGVPVKRVNPPGEERHERGECSRRPGGLVDSLLNKWQQKRPLKRMRINNTRQEGQYQ